MNAEILLSYFDRISDAPDAVPRLRKFILDLAVRGTLVDQDQHDEPASELMKRISAEKERLVREGRVKNTDPIEPPKASELPYALPEGWQWKRFNDVASIQSNLVNPRDHPDAPHIAPDNIESYTGRLLPYGTIGDSGVFSSKHLFYPGCILYSKIRPALAKVVAVDFGGLCSADMYPLLPFLNRGYLLRYMLTTVFVQQSVSEDNRVAMPKINREALSKILVPVPPSAEQQRIVAKVDELMGLCDHLEDAQKKREARRHQLSSVALHRLNNGISPHELREGASFFLNNLPKLTARPNQIKGLRQTILNLAVRGRLLPQRSEDEPTSDLLVRVKAERCSRGVERTRRLSAPELPPVDLSLAPFDIPANWTWARFPDLGTFGRGKSKHRPRNDQTLFEGGTYPLVQTGDVARSKGVIETYTAKYNEKGLAQSQKWPAGTLCITIAANIADSGILSFAACFPDSVVGFIPASVFPNARYFEYFLRTAKANLLEFAPATAQKNINLEILNAILIPLPPLAEQLRIVARVDQLMAICDDLEAQLSTIQHDGEALLEAVLHRAFLGKDSDTTRSDNPCLDDMRIASPNKCAEDATV